MWLMYDDYVVVFPYSQLLFANRLQAISKAKSGTEKLLTEVSLPSTFDPQFGEWIERPEEIEMLTKRFLKALGDMASWPDAVQKGDSRSACRLDFMLVAYVNNERVDVLNMEIGHPNSHKRKQEQDRLKYVQCKLICYCIYSYEDFLGDDLRVYSINMEYGILKNCLLTQATIPLHMVSTETIYPLIHSLLTLRVIAIICTLQKLIAYLEKNKVENSDISDEKIAKTILLPKRRKSNINLTQQKSKK
ncbi:unnamed protein product [Rhizophagus irregularis]|nr:unnamed protein product [Rhizophagus irregularis]